MMKKKVMFFLLVFLSINLVSAWNFQDKVYGLTDPSIVIETYYAEMWNYSRTTDTKLIIIDAAGVYHNVTNLTLGSVKDFTFYNNNEAMGGSHLEAKVAGLYQVHFSMTFSGVSNGGLYGFSLGHNWLPNTNRNCYGRRDARTDVGSISFSCLMELEVNDNVSLMVENEMSNKNMEAHTININLLRIGDM